MIGSTVAIAHSRGSTAAMTAVMSRDPSRAPSMSGWIPRSQIPVRLDGARTSAAFSGGRGPSDWVPPAGFGVEVGGSPVTCGTATVSSAGHPKRDASAVAKSPPAPDQPTMASTWLSTSAVVYSTGGSSASTEAAMPAPRNWSAAVLATATDVGSLAAAPITNEKVSPLRLIRPRVV